MTRSQDATNPAGWHALSAAEALAALGSQPSGLSSDEATRRRKRFGPNALRAPRRASALSILLNQLKSIVVVLLVAAAVVALSFGDIAEALAIGVVVLLNTALGFSIEFRSVRAMEGLLQLDVPSAVVVRGGDARRVDARELVPGDVIEIERGRKIPADARLLETADVTVDEAPLTGESLPVSKNALDQLPENTPLAERSNLVFKGTTVASGLGRAVVFATSLTTEVGRIGTLLESVRLGRTPLEKRLDELGRRLVWLALTVAAVVAVLDIWHGQQLHLSIETAIALAVAAVPEALPAVATIALAVGVYRMGKRHALVRRLPAVEALGATTVVCTDKTRTLTSGAMTAVRVWCAGAVADLNGDVPPESPARHVLAAAARASRTAPAHDRYRAVQNDPVDAAVLTAAARAGVSAAAPDERPRVNLIPFSSERQLMASFHSRGRELVAYVKGSPGKVIHASGRVLTAAGVADLDEAGRQALRDGNSQLAQQGLRVIAVAEGLVPEPAESALVGLTFLGFIGFIDPPAPGVRETIERLRGAGLRTIMLTGDQRLTAQAIGLELGLLDDGSRVLDGADLNRLGASAMDGALHDVAAVSRITPEHKLSIVRALQARGEIVAMLGDGVNDAAALKQADVGVAMGERGTDIAKEAAAIVLGDDRFETIGAAVEEGRVIHDNIRKFVFYLFSCNLAEILVLLAAGVAALPLPLLPLQLLWLNLVTDTFPALALAMEPADADVMRRPPRRPDEAILSAATLRSIAAYALLLSAVTFGAYLWSLGGPPARATTMAFATLALAEIAHLGNARSNRAVLRPVLAASNRYALAAVLLSAGLLVLAVSWAPLRTVLGVVPLTALEWLVVAGFAALPAVAGQMWKIVASATRGASDKIGRHGPASIP